MQASSKAAAKASKPSHLCKAGRSAEGICRTDVVAHTSGLHLQRPALKGTKGSSAVLETCLNLHAEVLCLMHRRWSAGSKTYSPQ